LQAIETARLNVRPFQPDDWQAVFDYMSSPVVTTWLPEGSLTAEETRAFVAENTIDEPKALAVWLKRGHGPIGHMLFHPWFAHRTYEIGWVFAEPYQGQGYATEAARALLTHGFETLGLHRVIATCQPENIASWRVMEKLGMRREGHFRRCIYRGEDRWWDEYFYALLADEWQPAAASA
jgi:RimJ/RimL family protein N-acetyltransferase